MRNTSLKLNSQIIIKNSSKAITLLLALLTVNYIVFKSIEKFNIIFTTYSKMRNKFTNIQIIKLKIRILSPYVLLHI